MNSAYPIRCGHVCWTHLKTLYVCGNVPILENRIQISDKSVLRPCSSPMDYLSYLLEYIFLIIFRWFSKKSSLIRTKIQAKEVEALINMRYAGKFWNLFCFSIFNRWHPLINRVGHHISGMGRVRISSHRGKAMTLSYVIIIRMWCPICVHHTDLFAEQETQFGHTHLNERKGILEFTKEEIYYKSR